MKKPYSGEQTVAKVRQADVGLARGLKVSDVCSDLGISEQTYYRLCNTKTSRLLLWIIAGVTTVTLLAGCPKKKPVKLENTRHNSDPEQEESKRSPEFLAIKEYWQDNSDLETKEVLETLDKGLGFFRGLQKNDDPESGWNTPGGYAWTYSPDLTQRSWRKANINPKESIADIPGTPTVGMLFLNSFKATGNLEYLKAAEEAGGRVPKVGGNSGSARPT